MSLPTPLVSVDELVDRLGSMSLFDLRWALTDPNHGRAAYEAGHIPGAVFVDLDQDLAAREGDGRHPLPPLEDFAATLGRLGVDANTEIVVYDDSAGSIAARLWWMLHSIGHESVKLLDGGIDQWTEAGLPLEAGSNVPQPKAYEPRHGFVGVVRHDDLDAREVVDVRAANRYRGESEPVDPKAGHIPGAMNLPISMSLHEGIFKSPEQLRQIYDHLGPDPVLSCGSGVNACHTALAMVRAGRPMPDIYIGSFSDWSRRDLPVATGPAP